MIKLVKALVIFQALVANIHDILLVSIKIIRNKITGLPEGYGFVEFVSHAAAERILQTYNGTPMPGTEQMFVGGSQEMAAMAGAVEQREEPYDPLATPDVDKQALMAENFLYHATSLTINFPAAVLGFSWLNLPTSVGRYKLIFAWLHTRERHNDPGPDHSIFVGDLAPDVTDYLLQETFRAHYPSVRGAKVVTDPNTGRSKGYGFVKFSDETERNRAMTEMNGVYCSTRAMRISAATPKKTTGFQQQYAVAKAAVYPALAYTATTMPVLPPDNDQTNTTIFVGNLDLNVTEEVLKQFFLPLGEIVCVKIPATKGCGYVLFANRNSAEEAIRRMQGQMIGQQVVQITWGRIPTANQDLPGSWGAQIDPNQWNAYYGYGQGYDAYSYGATQDPSLYAYGAYAGYAQYPQQASDLGLSA
ncbi:hypothetical protein GOBAR_AA15221 [Gossypium barbadense]|uniref:RRM domain-containing protein n=1 Tax=Gossypium barbadense TaxID=3634 RepID=A0A2P5XQ32_GOSBA|nr:hypothetical protein GOBAR_AA15221 [Gossypium barbadense]